MLLFNEENKKRNELEKKMNPKFATKKCFKQPKPA